MHLSIHQAAARRTTTHRRALHDDYRQSSALRSGRMQSIPAIVWLLEMRLLLLFPNHLLFRRHLCPRPHLCLILHLPVRIGGLGWAAAQPQLAVSFKRSTRGPRTITIVSWLFSPALAHFAPISAG